MVDGRYKAYLVSGLAILYNIRIIETKQALSLPVSWNFQLYEYHRFIV